MENVEIKEKIQILYQEIERIVSAYLITQKRNNIEQVKKIVPQLQEYALWFIEKNRLNIDNEQYQELRAEFILALNDIITAVEQKDGVLLNDVLAWDMLSYLKMCM